MLNSFTRGSIAEKKLDEPLCHDQTSATEEECCHTNSFHENIAEVTSMYEAVAKSLEYLFTNRKKCQRLGAHLVHWLDILESRMNKIVLNGKVGQASPASLPTFQGVKRSVRLDPEVQRATVKAVCAKKKRK